MQSQTADSPGVSTVDPDEVTRFAAVADAWWDPRGAFAPLHKLNPTRLSYIRDQICRHFGRDPRSARSLDGLAVLDVGCGGGLLAEPITRMGAAVTGIDATAQNIRVAGLHAQDMELEIDYRHIAAEELAAEGAAFDVVVNMEVIEHVADVPAFLAACRALVRPGGIMLFSTLNRTAKAFAMAIVGAEYVLRWLPRGTHDWQKFLKPAELSAALDAAGFTVPDLSGLSYDPLGDRWRVTRDLSVNYLGTALP
ncbi:MAG: bifunctional 2-polyprenyl-6-hydroxyphenol methylase/3-demethylubiquinol 3-O-methyltransferase UbiG, partial [Sphingomonadales bacterium]|nr:bifunctional 2-polyprenyl-6-hydroxyphenol methylase/3-demethylubiquinol 3-O-methyltransferase UbiG [Sphingomonadales bacterium]